MAILNTNNLTQSQIVNNAISLLKQHRGILNDLAGYYAWSSGITAADLEALGLDAATAAGLLSAIADAHAEFQIHNTGLPPASYPQPASAYVYAESQDALIGPAIP
jgi:hypothetical protein